MKTLIATAVGGLALGGLVTAQAMRSPNLTAAPHYNTAETRTVAQDATTGPVLVNCGAGRQAVIRPTAASANTQVDCVDTLGLAAAPYVEPVSAFTTPAATFASQTYTTAPRTVVQERVVYRDRAVAQPTYRQASGTRTSRTAPVYRTSTSEYARPQGRTWKKSALIIGGSAAGGAGVGAIIDGKSGAKKGAVLGGVGGLVYDLATRNKDRR